MPAVLLVFLDVKIARRATYIVVEELHNKGGYAAVNSDEQVDAG